MALSLDPKHLKRYGQIAALLVRHGREDVIRDTGLEEALDAPLPAAEPGAPATDDLEERAESLTDDLERLGPTYVKLGQLLATRADLLPEPYLQALARLQDRVDPIPFEDVERAVFTELGVRLSKAFAEFEDAPLAAASLSQVHRARLRDGRPVAVKVQRPAVRALLRDDLDALRELAEFLDRRSDRAHRYRLPDILEQFRRSLLRELDFRNEAENLLRLGENLAGFDGIVVPRPVHDYTTSRVLTMDLVHGRKVTALGPLALMEIDREDLAEALFRAYLKQILVDGFFHADPHPGNVLITDDGRLALIDVGQTATLAPATRDALTRLLLAVGDGDADEAARLLLDLSEPEPGADEDAFSEAVADLVMRSQGRTAAQISLGAVVLGLVRMAGAHRISPPPELAMLGKALVSLDEVGRALDPDLEPNRLIQRHAAELLERQMTRSLRPASLFKAAMEANELVQRMPARLNRILDVVAENRLKVDVNAIDEARLIAGLEKIANRITLGLVIAALIIGAAMLVRVEGGPELLGYPALALVFFLVAAVAGIALALQIVLRDHRDGDA